MQRFFPQDSVEYGGKWTRGYRIQCGVCQRIEKVPINTAQSGGSGDDSVIIAGRVQLKLEELGWLVGKRDKDDRCPECRAPRTNGAAHLQAPDDNAFLLKRSPPIPPPAQQTPQPAPTEATAAPDKPNGHDRVLTREDRRVIFAKLENVYDCETTGYEVGWTDARVARDLGVPRDWIVKLREENFGTLADNPEMRAVVTEARQLFDDVKATRADVQRVVATISTLTEEAKKYQAEIQRLAQRIQPMEKRIADLLKANT